MAKITVIHEKKDGWNEFTSPDLPGLYVACADADLELTFADLPNIISAIIAHDGIVNLRPC